MDPVPSNPGKPQLRETLRRKRRRLDAQYRNSLDEAINTTIIREFKDNSGDILAAYLAFDGEPDLSASLSALSSIGLRIALPAIKGAVPIQSLEFRSWQEGQNLGSNAFGINEPLDGEQVALQDIDALLMPLVAWDRKGNRLGMGARIL